jgi:hypothetical protein
MSQATQSPAVSTRRSLRFFLLSLFSVALVSTGLSSFGTWKILDNRYKNDLTEKLQEVEKQRDDQLEKTDEANRHRLDLVKQLQDAGLKPVAPQPKPEAVTPPEGSPPTPDVELSATQLVEKAKKLLQPEKGKPTTDQVKEAIKLLNLAIGKDEKLSAAWAQRSKANELLGDKKAARKDRDESLRLSLENLNLKKKK